jgi:predicted ATPase/DNA-binding SARP family transcriptional activator
MLQIYLLGNVSINLDNQPVGGLPSRAAEAMLIYLACHDHPIPRETLAELLWADRSQKQALTNLRTILTSLKRELGEYLIITRQSIAFNHAADYWLDTVALEEQLNRLKPALLADSRLDEDEIEQLQNTLDLYQDAFLAGFYLKDGRGFEEWAAVQRERLRRLAYTGFRQLVRTLHDQGDYLNGIRYADQLLLMDPYDEDAHRQMMWLQARSGKRNAALKHFQSCQNRLIEDLGVEPSPATIKVFERLRATSFPPPDNLPQTTTAFIGREVEVKAVLRRLSRSSGRLVSILGPGGVGKTRLAIEAARRIVQTRPGMFLDGVTFLPLAALQSPAYLNTTLGETLNIRFEGEEPTLAQLIHHLEKKEMLLVLDNFEHLVDRTSLAFLARILEAAPGIKILLTSRERLRLRDEQVLDLGGLPYPPMGTDEEIAFSYGSIQLFFQHAERVRQDYSPSPEDLRAIIQLCKLLDGMPLGIELAAAGVRYFPPREILHQLQEKVDLEFSQTHDRPDRHQNLHSVFEHSWSLLTDDEQQITRRMAVFQGPFDLEAAEAITGATRDQITMLLDKSLLRRDDKTGGFDLHPLMQQFLAVKLTSIPDEEIIIRTRHAEYYAAFIVFGDPKSNMEQQFRELREKVDSRQENIISAALWFAEQHDFSERKLVTTIERLNLFFNATQRFENWKVVYHQLIEALGKKSDGSYEEKWITTVLESRIVYADINLHAPCRASLRLENILQTAYELQNKPLISICHSLSALIGWRKANFNDAIAQSDKSIMTVHDFPEQFRWPPLRIKGDIAFGAGMLTMSKKAHDQAFALAMKRDSFDEAAPLHRLSEGRILHRRGEIAAARDILMEGLSLSRAKGVPSEIITISQHLAHVLIDLGDYQGAEDLLAEARRITLDIKDTLLPALVGRTLGWLAECSENPETAQQQYRESLELVESIQYQPELPFSQVALGRVMGQRGDQETAKELILTALETFKGWEHHGGIATAQHSLGLQFEQADQMDASMAAYLAGLAAADRGQEYYFGGQLYVQLAHLWAADEAGTQALALATSIQASPAMTAKDKIRTAALHGKLTAALSPVQIDQAENWGRDHTLANSIAAILDREKNILGE